MSIPIDNKSYDLIGQNHVSRHLESLQLRKLTIINLECLQLNLETQFLISRARTPCKIMNDLALVTDNSS